MTDKPPTKLYARVPTINGKVLTESVAQAIKLLDDKAVDMGVPINHRDVRADTDDRGRIRALTMDVGHRGMKRLVLVLPEGYETQ